MMAMSKYTLLIGDARDKLRELQGGIVQTVVTSPPYYGLRDYGVDGQIGLEETPKQYVAALVGVFREVRRVLRDDGTVWLNLGDSYASGKNLLGIPWRVAFALQQDGWYLRQDIIWSKPNPMPESVTDRCTKAHEYIFLLSKSARYFYDAEAVRENIDAPPDVRKRASTFKKQGTVGGHHVGAETLEIIGRNRRSVWTVATQPYSGAHFATFPPKLIEPCILAGSKRGDIVLDPFGGSGTTAAVALDHGRDAILCELSEEYAALVPERINSITDALSQGRLFAE